MLNLILLVQTPQDVLDLPASIPVLKRLPLSACWLIYSPAVVVDVAAAHAEIDQQIAARQTAIREAAGREDFAGAEAHRQERDALVIRKAAVATDGIKASTPEQRQAMSEKVFGDFFNAAVAPSVEITEHTQHYELRDWCEMVNGLKGRWPSILPHGGFMVTWPGQVGEMALHDGRPVATKAEITTALGAIKASASPAIAPIEKKPERKQTYMQTPRFSFLCALGIDALYEEARKAGIINPSGSKKQIVHLVARTEFEAQKVAA